jgi:hypothetical protein
MELVGVPGLEDDLHELLGEAGEAVSSGVGCGLWSVDLVLYDGEAPDVWVERVASYLRNWGAPKDTQLRVGMEEAVAVFPSGD